MVSIIEKRPEDCGWRTSLGWSKVFARRRGAGTSATRLLDAQSAALDDFALQSFLCGVGFLRAHHVHESETTALAAVGIAHDVAFLNRTILLEQARDLVFAQLGVDAGHEEVRSGVGGLVVGIVLGRVIAAPRRVSILVRRKRKMRGHTGCLCRWQARRGCECRRRGRRASESAHVRSHDRLNGAWSARVKRAVEGSKRRWDD